MIYVDDLAEEPEQDTKSEVDTKSDCRGQNGNAVETLDSTESVAMVNKCFLMIFFFHSRCKNPLILEFFISGDIR